MWVRAKGVDIKDNMEGREIKKWFESNLLLIEFTDTEIMGISDGCNHSTLPNITQLKMIISFLRQIKNQGQKWIDKHNEKEFREEGYNICITTTSKKIETKPKKGYIYFAKRGKYTKIGLTTKNPIKRIKQLNNDKYPDATVLLHAFKTNDTIRVENSFHKEFENKRVKGEWFKLTEEDIEEIKKIKEI